MKETLDSEIYKPGITCEDVQRIAHTKVHLTQKKIAECLAAQENILSRNANITDPKFWNQQMDF